MGDEQETELERAMHAAGFTCNAASAGGGRAWKRVAPDAADGCHVTAEDRGEDAPPLRRFGVAVQVAGDSSVCKEWWTLCGDDLPRLAASVAADPARWFR